jgi:putative hydrolase of the HAD superfamily
MPSLKKYHKRTHRINSTCAVKKVKNRLNIIIQSSQINKPSHKIKTILLDLDNSLYDKNQYMKQAFEKVSLYLAENHHLKYHSIYSLLQRIVKVKTGRYEFFLKDLLRILGIYSEELFNKVINIYHNVKPVMKPYLGVKKLLKELKKKYKLVLLTDDYPQIQKNKMVALGLNKSFNMIVYTTNYSHEKVKPYRLALDKIKISPQKVIYVGDNPYHDFRGAKELGIFTIRILQGGFKSIHLDDREADISIKNLIGLRKLLLNRSLNQLSKNPN